ncbi:hypothetical protein BZA05DRAFT_85627 [Tricharina praecox]|uniref:uncharacterized protein n=1 Tax=Tricharina praecox TaxID=43433 RepID=UPI00221EC825|nr:uncharacterized protein BZA05DRAFT_85627 [Tricharina praecox]KAI5849202.1 hypothetical protein BZA05DRAFT_85627 [Tricharina praecox]
MTTLGVRVESWLIACLRVSICFLWDATDATANAAALCPYGYAGLTASSRHPYDYIHHCMYIQQSRRASKPPPAPSPPPPVPLDHPIAGVYAPIMGRTEYARITAKETTGMRQRGGPFERFDKKPQASVCPLRLHCFMVEGNSPVPVPRNIRRPILIAGRIPRRDHDEPDPAGTAVRIRWMYV